MTVTHIPSFDSREFEPLPDGINMLTPEGDVVPNPHAPLDTPTHGTVLGVYRALDDIRDSRLPQRRRFGGKDVTIFPTTHVEEDALAHYPDLDVDHGQNDKKVSPTGAILFTDSDGKTIHDYKEHPERNTDF